MHPQPELIYSGIIEEMASPAVGGAGAGAGVGPIAGAGVGAGAVAGAGVGPVAGVGPNAGNLDDLDDDDDDPYKLDRRQFNEEEPEDHMAQFVKHPSTIKLDEFIYPVKWETLTKEDADRLYYIYDGVMVNVSYSNGSFSMTHWHDDYKIEYTGGVLYSDEFPNTINGLFTLCSLKRPLTVKQLTAAYRFIKDHPEDLNIQNDRGETPLMTAIIHSRWTLAAKLITVGADHTLRSAEGNTAADYFCLNTAKKKNTKGSERVYSLLKERLAPVGKGASTFGKYNVKPASGLFSCFGFGGHRTRRTKKRKQRKPRRRSTRK